MNKHSKAPWRFVEDRGDRYIYDADGGALMCDMQYYPWAPTDDADWQLIAAAPLMLEALQMVREYVVSMKGKGHGYQVAIDAALAAATGEQPHG